MTGSINKDSPVNKFNLNILPDDLKLAFIDMLSPTDLKTLVISSRKDEGLKQFFDKPATWQVIAKHRNIKIIPSEPNIKKQVLDFLTLQPVEGVKYALKSLSKKISDELSQEFNPKILDERLHKMLHSANSSDQRRAEATFIDFLTSASKPIDNTIQNDLQEQTAHERDLSEQAVNIYIENGFINAESGLQPWGAMLEAAVGNPIIFKKLLVEVIKALKENTGNSQELFDQFSPHIMGPVMTHLINNGAATKEYTAILLKEWQHHPSVPDIRLAIEIGLSPKDPELAQFKLLLGSMVPSFMTPYVNAIEAEKLKEFDSDPDKKTQVEAQIAKMRALIAGDEPDVKSEKEAQAKEPNAHASGIKLEDS